VVLLAAIGTAFFTLPLAGLLANVPWRGLGGQLAQQDVREALLLSLICPLGATGISLLLGVPLAWVLARGTFPGRRALRSLVVLPMVLPPVVGGIALLYAFGRGGIAGRWLYHAFGWQLTYTTAGVMVAEAFVSMPFLVLAVEAGFAQLDPRLEEAAAGLGGGQLAVFRLVTLPLMAPSVATGAILCWARSLGELGATITFAGDLPGTTQTAPLAVFLALQTQPQDAIALSLVLFVASIAVLYLLRDRWLPVR
jgi:molybdate transport system permease protein